MLLGFVSDAHGNPFGLETCLSHLKKNGAESIFFLGDAIGYLPWSNETLDLLDRFEVTCIKGNHEAMLLGLLPLDPIKDTTYQLSSVKAQLSAEQYQQITSWPTLLDMQIDGQNILLVHGSPTEPLTGRLNTIDDLKNLPQSNFDLVVVGHTHRPFLAQHHSIQFMNVGSCGLPRDIGNMAACGSYDTVTKATQIYRLEMPVQNIIERCPKSVHPAVVKCLRRTATTCDNPSTKKPIKANI